MIQTAVLSRQSFEMKSCGTTAGLSYDDYCQHATQRSSFEAPLPSTPFNVFKNIDKECTNPELVALILRDAGFPDTFVTSISNMYIEKHSSGALPDSIKSKISSILEEYHSSVQGVMTSSQSQQSKMLKSIHEVAEELVKALQMNDIPAPQPKSHRSCCCLPKCIFKL